jgi:fumarate hydratase subunit beta
MIGKGKRSREVNLGITRHKALYLAAIGGAGALISQSVKKQEVVAYEDLGTEAILKLEVEDFPLIVAVDSYGEDIYSR